MWRRLLLWFSRHVLSCGSHQGWTSSIMLQSLPNFGASFLQIFAIFGVQWTQLLQIFASFGMV